MSQDTQTTMDEEAPLSVEALLYSRTDPRGIILSGNDGFRSVSEHDWAGLLGAPCARLRHPEMPRAVFWRMWSELQAGRPFGAYLRNRTLSGRSFWLFAVICPDRDGYLSVQFRPTSDLFPVIRAEYAALLQEESAEALSPQDAAMRLDARLQALGHADHAAFMADATAREMRSRDALMERPADPAIARFERMQEAMADIRTRSQTIRGALEAVRTVPANLRIQASRLGDLAGPVGVIAVNHSELSGEIRIRIDAMFTALDRVGRTLSDGMLVACSARLMGDMVALFERGGGSGPEGMPVAAEIDHLRRQRGYGMRARQEIQDIRSHVDSFAGTCEDMSRIMTGLGVTRVMCRVEAARLAHRSSGLDEIIKRLDAFEGALNHYLDGASEVISHLRETIDQQSRSLPSRAAA